MPEEEKPKKGITPQQLWELDAAFDAMMEQSAAMQRFADRISRKATEIAFEEFPILKMMEADQIREFGDKIWRMGDQLASEIDSITYRVENPNAKKPGLPS